MLLAPRAVYVVALTLALTPGAFAQCSKDTDCKGDRVCVNGTCTDPSTKPASSAQPAAAPSTSGSAPCQFEAPEYETLVMRADGKLIPMTYLTASVDQKMGGLIGNAFSFGIGKVKATTMLRINKERASLRIHDRQPQSLDIFTPVGFSPDNIYIVRMTPRDNARYLQTGTAEANASGSSSSGFLLPDGIRIEAAPDLVSRQCVHEGKKVAVYRLRPAEPLKDGEYAFLSQGRQFFDFGVDAK